MNEEKEFKEEKKRLFHDVFNPAPQVDNEAWYSHFVEHKHLAYDGTGKVIVVDDGPYDLYQEIQVDVESSTLSSQLKMMAVNGKLCAPGINYGDVSDLPDNINDYQTYLKSSHDAAQKAAQAVGIDDVNSLLNLKDDELKAVIDDHLNKKIPSEEKKEIKKDE